MAMAFAPTTADHALGRVANIAEILGAAAMAVRLYAAPKIINERVGGLVGEFSMPGALTIAIDQGPPERTKASAATQRLVARATSRFPVGNKPSRHAKPRTWKANQPRTQFTFGRNGTPKTLRISNVRKAPPMTPATRAGLRRKRGKMNGASAVSMV